MIFANFIGNGTICWSSPNFLQISNLRYILVPVLYTNINLKKYFLLPSFCPVTVECLATALNVKTFLSPPNTNLTARQ